VPRCARTVASSPRTSGGASAHRPPARFQAEHFPSGRGSWERHAWSSVAAGGRWLLLLLSAAFSRSGGPGVKRLRALREPDPGPGPGAMRCAARLAAARPGTGSCAQLAMPSRLLPVVGSGWPTPTRLIRGRPHCTEITRRCDRRSNRQAAVPIGQHRAIEPGLDLEQDRRPPPDRTGPLRHRGRHRTARPFHLRAGPSLADVTRPPGGEWADRPTPGVLDWAVRPLAAKLRPGSRWGCCSVIEADCEPTRGGL
jgi:hypothetical protein